VKAQSTVLKPTIVLLATEGGEIPLEEIAHRLGY
jgi:hypothetical protein